MSWTQRRRAEIVGDSYKPWMSEGDKVLDIGCGNGEVSLCLADNLNVEVAGTDIIDYRTPEARLFPFSAMESADRLPFEDGSFDVAMFTDILHHTEDPKKLLLEAKRLARKAVVVFEDCDSWLLRKVDVSLNFHYCSSMPCPLTFKTQDEWCELFRNLEFTVEVGQPKYPFWYPFRHMAFRLA